MNKKGFTLIEVIVSIALLALIGVAVGISLNRTLKNRNDMIYNEFIEKVKSSSMLYVNNTPDIINGLKEFSFKVIKVKELIDNGNIKDNLNNPDTGEKINPNDKIKISYNSDNELIIEYPYTDEKTDPYLYTLNYTTTYGKVEDNICYHGLNEPGLQLVYSSGENAGTKVHDLKQGETIKAYMENGTECTKDTINVNQIGTYKIRYDYVVVTGKDEVVKSAERTITIKPSKPVIDNFTIVPADSNNAYEAKIDLSATDVNEVKLEYCIVGVSTNDNTSLSDLIGKCSDTSRIVNNKVQLNNTWFKLTNGVLNNQTNKVKYTVASTFDISSEMTDLKDYLDIKFYVFVKNIFEEYSTNLNKYNDGIYNLNRIVTLNANGGKFSDGKIKVSFKVKYNSTFKEAMNNNSIYKTPNIGSSYVFEGWTSDGQTYLNTSEYKITEDMEFNAKWYLYCSSTTYAGESNCSLPCGGGTKTIYYKDKKNPSHSCNKTESCNTQECTTKPSSGGGTCKNYWHGPGSSTANCKSKYGVSSWYSNNQNCYGTTNPGGAGCCYSICS